MPSEEIYLLGQTSVYFKYTKCVAQQRLLTKYSQSRGFYGCVDEINKKRLPKAMFRDVRKLCTEHKICANLI